MTKQKSERAKISIQLRRLIETCGMTQYRLSKETKVARSTLSKFLNNPDFSLSLDAIDKLGAFLGWRITAETPPGTARATDTTSQARNPRGRKGKKEGQ